MNNNKLALISFICGCVAVVTGSAGIGVAAGVAAIILANKAKAEFGKHWMSTAGLIGGIVGIVYGLPATICTILCNCGMLENMSNY